MGLNNRPIYTKHTVLVCGGRDTVEVIIEHSPRDGRRKIIYNPNDYMKSNAIEGEDLDAGLASSIEICTGGRKVITSKQEAYGRVEKYLGVKI